VTTSNADACARACADDGLCIAWVRYTDGACELMAIAPSAPPSMGAEAGVASRAPPFAAWPAPVVTAEPVVIPVASLTVRYPETEATLVLLGGPEDEGLRPRLGSRE
jgi:hypothetical protein